MSSTMLLDACGRRRSPATLSSFHQGRPPRNKGQRYPADPPTVEEIIAVMHGSLGVGAADAVAAATQHAPGRRSVLRTAGPDTRSRVVPGGRAKAAAPLRGPSWRKATVRAASAAPRSRGGDVTRGRAAVGHPAPARARRPCDHLRVPTWDRQHRDRPRRSRAPGTDDPGHPRPVGLRRLILVGRPQPTHQNRQAPASCRADSA